MVNEHPVKNKLAMFDQISPKKGAQKDAKQAVRAGGQLPTSPIGEYAPGVQLSEGGDMHTSRDILERATVTSHYGVAGCKGSGAVRFPTPESLTASQPILHSLLSSCASYTIWPSDLIALH